MTELIYEQFYKDYLEEFLSPYGQLVMPKRVFVEAQEIDLYIPSGQEETNFTSLDTLEEPASPPEPSSFEKGYLKEVLSPYGQVVSKHLPADIIEIDLYFIPSETKETNFKALGFLGEIASPPRHSLFEAFHNPVTESDICNCLLKTLSLLNELRESKGENAEDDTDILNKLWILTPTASDEVLEGFNAAEKKDGMPGVYCLGEIFSTGIIVIDRLPEIPETLWLRLLGRSEVQHRAIDELEALPVNSPLRASASRLLINLQKNLEAREDLEPTDTELIMRLAPLYQQDQELAIQQGIQQGERLVIENLLRVRFGAIDPELLSTIDPMLALTPEEFTPLLLQLSREELVARFAKDS